jgi:hypothetical protein
MANPSHQVTQVGQAALKPRLLRAKANLEIAFLVTRAIQSESQKVNRLRTLSTPLASVPSRKSTKFNKFRLRWFEYQTELLQPSSQDILESHGILAILETHHKIIDVAHQIRLTP